MKMNEYIFKNNECKERETELFVREEKRKIPFGCERRFEDILKMMRSNTLTPNSVRVNISSYSKP